ncbi:MAG: hypothetical protein HY216_17105 [Candidatus Rokubacteria bacterium]|nr:hypothetical protein [Candidatus Rokubacteria bacterium]
MLVGLVYAGGVLVNLVLPLNHDAAVYATASALVADGRLPYRDFFSPTPPVVTYLHAAAIGVLGATPHAAARHLSALLGLAVGVLLFVIPARIAGPAAGTLSVALIACSWYGDGPASIAFGASYILAPFAFFLLCAVYAELFITPRALGIVTAAAALSLAIGTRLVVPVLGAYLLYVWYVERRMRLVLLALGTMVVSCAVIGGYFVARYPEETWVSIVRWLRDALPGVGYTARWWTLSVAEALGSLPLLFIPLAALALAALFDPPRTFWPRPGDLTVGHRLDLLAAAVIVPSVVMFWTVPQIYVHHQLFYLVLGAMVVAVHVCRRWPWTSDARIRRTLVIAGILALLWPPLMHRDGAQKLLANVRAGLRGDRFPTMVATVERLTPPGGMVFTFNPYVALLAHRSFPSGLEFSFMGFTPYWDTARALRFHRFNEDVLVSWVTARTVDVILLTDKDARPFQRVAGTAAPAYARAWTAFERAVAEHYRLVERYPVDDYWGEARFYVRAPAR